MVVPQASKRTNTPCQIKMYKEKIFGFGELEVTTSDELGGDRDRWGSQVCCHMASGRTRTFPGLLSDLGV